MYMPGAGIWSARPASRAVECVTIIGQRRTRSYCCTGLTLACHERALNGMWYIHVYKSTIENVAHNNHQCIQDTSIACRHKYLHYTV